VSESPVPSPAGEPLRPPSYEELAEQNGQLRDLLVQALAEIADLKAQLSKTSKNSSKPPSSDGLAKPAPKSLRGKSKRGPGRPKGQMGFTLSMVEEPDHEQVHEPHTCDGCGAGLDGAVLAGVERRQVFDLPPLALEVTQHHLNSRRCGCGTVTKAIAPEGVNAPVQYGPRLAGVGIYLFHGQFLSRSRTCQALTDLFGARVAASSVASWVRRAAAVITVKALPEIVQRIVAAPVAHFDETGFRTAGSLHWMHSASTPTDVLLSVHPKRGIEGMKDAGVLPGFTGVAVHDAWAPYDTHTGALHALCNAHALRELIYVADTTDTDRPQVAALARQGIEAMIAVKSILETAGVSTAEHLEQANREELNRQQHLMRSAFVLARTATAGRATKLERKFNALFTRLLDRWDDYQRYTTEPGVPFDNNPAEQTIRMPKLRIKVSGCLRTLTGAREFAAIRSYTATATRNGQNMLTVLVQAAAGQPWTHATA